MTDLTTEIMDPVTIRTKISELEAEMKKHPQLEIATKHYFSQGVYAREITIPKGAVVVGKIHKHQNLNIMSKGRGAIISLDGAMEIEAPYTVVSAPGVKRAYHAYEDTVWTTIHGTNETDLEKIENDFIAPSYDDVVSLDSNEAKKLQE